MTFNTNFDQITWEDIMKNNKTTLSILSHGVTASIDFDNKDVTVGEMFDAFKSAMIGVSYTESQINDYIKQLAYELTDNE